ncbi:MAG: UDP-glucose/GDP-mannose dehydrogenase family protein [Actinomycetales bacterium]|nr:UDP-glucose/GDP-mannose dehydrogenase family protein [Actinomycetales bacterium]
MRISVIGCGYLGAVHAAAMAGLGHDVVAIDVDEAKIALLAAGKTPFYEPGLPEILASSLASGRLTFTTDISLVRGCEVHFIAVGTPQSADSNAADMRFVDAAVTALIPHLSEGDLVVGKSTVPVGTAARLGNMIAASGSPAELAWNPEFLREGHAVKDTISPDRLVYGVAPGARRDASLALLNAVYESAITAGTPVVVTDLATAELVKIAANAFLATKISFINAMSEITDAVGANITELADAIGYDARIGRRFLNAGVGFGGGCLPKDIRAFVARAEELGLGASVAFLMEVDAINQRQRTRVTNLVRGAAATLDIEVGSARIAVLGLAFKPHSDDVRDSPALDVVLNLSALGADVIAFDPEANSSARRRFPALATAASIDEALAEADVVVLVTEWPQFVALDPVHVASLVRNRAIVDARNVLDPVAWRAAGFTFVGMGRP